MAEKFTDSFIEEVLRLALIKKSFFEKISNYLKYQYLPTVEHKEIYKSMISSYTLNGELPSFGLLSEQHKSSPKIQSLLVKIKNCEIVNQDILLPQLESYIKDVMFSDLWDQVKETYDGGKRDEARVLMQKESSKIVEFSIHKNDGRFLRVFRDFDKEMVKKEIRKEKGEDYKKKIPTGILPIDVISHGGLDKKETLLFIMRSGVGKSTTLKSIGMYACQLGYRVLHIQCEGSEEECFDKYTQNWTALPYMSVKNSHIESEVMSKLRKVRDDMMINAMDIDIKAFEQFDEVSMLDVRDCVTEYIKENGEPPDLLLLDSVDLVHPGDGVKYGVDTQSVKMKLQNSSRKFKNICNEFDIAGATATQTSDVNISIWNDPDKYLTRSDSMGDKNIANSYSFVITGNQTLDEEKKEQMRLYFDKMRHYGLKQRIYPICTNYGLGRFYNKSRTLRVFQDIYKDSD